MTEQSKASARKRKQRQAAQARVAANPDAGDHGSTNGYTNQGCRCQPCRDANNAYYQKRSAERAELIVKDPSLAPHDNESTYKNWGCRCRPCMDSHAAYKRRYRKRRAS